MGDWTAKDVTDAIYKKYHSVAALVPEVVLNDDEYEKAVQARWLTAYPEHRKRFVEKHGYYDGEFTAELKDYLTKAKPYRRIDLLMVKGVQTTAVEIKVSRADYFADTPEKRRPWQAATNRFVYAVPSGLVDPSEVPPGIGLWYVTSTALDVVKRASIDPAYKPLPPQVVTALAYRCSYKP